MVVVVEENHERFDAGIGNWVCGVGKLRGEGSKQKAGSNGNIGGGRR